MPRGNQSPDRCSLHSHPGVKNTAASSSGAPSVARTVHRASDWPWGDPARLPLPPQPDFSGPLFTGLGSPRPGAELPCHTHFLHSSSCRAAWLLPSPRRRALQQPRAKVSRPPVSWVLSPGPPPQRSQPAAGWQAPLAPHHSEGGVQRRPDPPHNFSGLTVGCPSEQGVRPTRSHF